MPDRLGGSDGSTFASYREDAQSIRVFLNERGVRTEFATPVDARRGVYEEHDVTWVLPVIATLAGGGLMVSTPLIVDWIRDRLRGLPAEDVAKATLVYRDATLDLETRRLTVREIARTSRAVAELLSSQDQAPGALPGS